MKYFRFKTFTTSYYFPQLNTDQRYMYGLYCPYGGKLSRLYWWLFRKNRLVRYLTAVKESELPFPYDVIKLADGTDCLMAFNMGSPGVEQKISILGYDNMTGQPFFAKFSQKKKAIELTRNEAMIYQKLQSTGLTPKLLKMEEVGNGLYMKVEYVEGRRPESTSLDKQIIDIAIRLGNYHLEDSIAESLNLKTGLSHGDFCPWNFLISNGEAKLIDWEMAAERPLGYDFFTYICNVSILLYPQLTLKQTIDEHRDLISYYFAQYNIEDWLPYLKYYAKDKYEYELGKGFKDRADKIKLLENYEAIK